MCTSQRRYTNLHQSVRFGDTDIGQELLKRRHRITFNHGTTDSLEMIAASCQRHIHATSSQCCDEERILGIGPTWGTRMGINSIWINARRLASGLQAAKHCGFMIAEHQQHELIVSVPLVNGHDLDAELHAVIARH